MWNVAVSMPCSIAQSIVRSKTDGVVVVHAEDEAPVDHHAEVVQPTDQPPHSRGGGSGTSAAPARLAADQRFEADEQAAQPRLDGPLQEIRRQHRIDGARRLPQTAHAAHAVEERRREAPVAEEMVVEEVEMAARQTVDLGERRIDRLGVERTAPFEERLLVTEVTDVRAARATRRSSWERGTAAA